MFTTYRGSRTALLLSTFIIGVLFLTLSLVFMLEPSGQVLGFTEVLEQLQIFFHYHYLFHNLYFVSIVLLLFIGIPEVISGLFLLARMRCGIIIGIVEGLFFMGFSIVACIIFTSSYWAWLMLAGSAFEIMMGAFTYVNYSRYVFYFNPEDYANINGNHKILIVYYSRDNYVRKYAYEIANRYHAGLCEIKTKDSYQGVKGFWRLWFHSYKEKDITLLPSDVDVKSYSHIYLLTPLILGNICAPIHQFAKDNRENISSVEYDFVHFMPLRFGALPNKLDSLFGEKRTSAISTCMHYGLAKSIQIL